MQGFRWASFLATKIRSASKRSFDPRLSCFRVSVSSHQKTAPRIYLLNFFRTLITFCHEPKVASSRRVTVLLGCHPGVVPVQGSVRNLLMFLLPVASNIIQEPLKTP